MKKTILFACAWLAFAVGFLGVFIPVLPTTPLLLLATFLFREQLAALPRVDLQTKVYGAYVKPFKRTRRNSAEAKGSHHRRILRRHGHKRGSGAKSPWWWAFFAAVALFLLWLMGMRIPTISEKKAAGLEE